MVLGRRRSAMETEMEMEVEEPMTRLWLGIC
jgi:hypothetical protein